LKNASETARAAQVVVRRSAQRQAGFTLIEIMVVVVILGILAALVVPQIMSRPDQAKVTVAKSDIKAVSAALDMYKLDNYAYPSTQQGLEALVDKPSGNPPAKNWNRDGYLKRLPVDPWGNVYQYLAPGTRGAFDLYSLGADGKQGGSDLDADIGNWDL
jgi:general secretion pathway protein G